MPDVQIKDGGTNEKLNSIRKRLGIGKGIFVTPRTELPLEGEIRTLNEFRGIIKGDILIYEGIPVFAYIPDHIIGDYTVDTPPRDLKKVHFTFCDKLREMVEEGRFRSRYFVTNHKDNIYRIFLPGGQEKKRRLLPCRYCLGLSGYRCYSQNKEPQRTEIVESFDAREAKKLLWQIFDIFRKDVENLRSADEIISVGYPQNWPKISPAYRKKQNFTCEICKVNLSRDKLQRLADAHHKDGDQQNSNDDNLECLCKECHSHKHSHYRVGARDRRAIQEERKRQGLPSPGD